MTYRVVGGYHGESRMMEEYIYIHSCPHYDRCASSIRLADASLLGDAGQVCRDVHAHAHWKLEKYVFFELDSNLCVILIMSLGPYYLY